MSHGYQLPDLRRRSFARTNLETIAQRVALLCELLPGTESIGELCCGDCTQQWRAYTQQLGVRTYLALDIDGEIVERNRRAGIACTRGDVLDSAVLSRFLNCDVLFFGPPLSVGCDGHRALRFDQVTPGYAPFSRLLLSDLSYDGTVVMVCPNSTTMGDITWLHHQVQDYRYDVGLRLIHHSYAAQTGHGEVTDTQLRYVELWFSSRLSGAWEIRESRP
jgi:hypothetical protein